MQSNRLSEQELVRKCMEELCKKEGFASLDNLVQRDFEFLCGRVETKTGVLISLSTMKRLSNSQFTRLPQVATLNAICQCIGYETWQDFKKHQRQNNPGMEISSTPVVKSKRRHAGYIIFGIVAGMLLLAFAWFGFKKRSLGNLDSAQFSFVKTTANDLPNTVVFTYDVENVAADSFFIQQSWDRNRRVKIDKHKHTFTDIYYEPGYHVAKLIANDSVIKTVDVSIPTDRWVFYAKERAVDNRPKYITVSSAYAGGLQIQKVDAVKGLVDLENENDFMMVYFPSKIQYSSDNFTMKFRVKMEQIKNNPCPYIMFEIFAQRYFMYVSTRPKGCSHEITGQFGNAFLNGNTDDLSPLSMNVTDWQDVEVSVKDKNVSIIINSKEAYTTHYTDTCGLITGLGFISNGLCQVEFVDLKTSEGNVVYQRDFIQRLQ